MEIKNEKVVVLGAGRSGIAAARVLKELGASVTLWDGKKDVSDQVKALPDEGISLLLGETGADIFDGVKLLVTSPGIPKDNALLQDAVRKNVPVWSEVELAYRLCKAPMVAVTGTNGKTTTTTLLGELCKTAFTKVAVGGNIGDPLSLQIAPLTETDLAVAEISSFQLEWVNDFAPHVAAILNITPDHMDRHKTFEEYTAMKKRVFLRQSAKDYVLLNYDDEKVRVLAKDCVSQVVFFSRTAKLQEGVFVEDGWVVIRWGGEHHLVFDLAQFKLRGAHNVENVLAACGAAFFAGVAPAAMAEVLAGFKAVEHRIEWVREKDGIVYYNDSKATNPESTIKALEAFSEQLLLIAGGYDKHTDLAPMMQLLAEKETVLILLGEATQRFFAAAQDMGVKQIYCVKDMKEAVSLAREKAKPGQAVLLSPACASYDMYSGYEERGRDYKSLVNAL